MKTEQAYVNVNPTTFSFSEDEKIVLSNYFNKENSPKPLFLNEKTEFRVAGEDMIEFWDFIENIISPEITQEERHLFIQISGAISGDVQLNHD